MESREDISRTENLGGYGLPEDFVRKKGYLCTDEECWIELKNLGTGSEYTLTREKPILIANGSFLDSLSEGKLRVELAPIPDEDASAFIKIANDSVLINSVEDKLYIGEIRGDDFRPITHVAYNPVELFDGSVFKVGKSSIFSIYNKDP